MLPDLNTIAEQLENPTQNNEAVITPFLEYEDTNTNMIFQYKASDMVLRIEMDASYLSKKWAHSRTGENY